MSSKVQIKNGFVTGIAFNTELHGRKINVPGYQEVRFLCHLLFSLRKKSPYLKLFWSVFSRIRTEYGEIQIISPCSVRMRENVDQNNSDYGHFSRSALHISSFSIVTYFIRFLNMCFHYTWC